MSGKWKDINTVELYSYVIEKGENISKVDIKKRLYNIEYTYTSNWINEHSERKHVGVEEWIQKLTNENLRDYKKIHPEAKHNTLLQIMKEQQYRRAEKS